MITAHLERGVKCFPRPKETGKSYFHYQSCDIVEIWRDKALPCKTTVFIYSESLSAQTQRWTLLQPPWGRAALYYKQQKNPTQTNMPCGFAVGCYRLRLAGKAKAQRQAQSLVQPGGCWPDCQQQLRRHLAKSKILSSCLFPCALSFSLFFFYLMYYDK